MNSLSRFRVQELEGFGQHGARLARENFAVFTLAVEYHGIEIAIGSLDVTTTISALAQLMSSCFGNGQRGVTAMLGEVGQVR